MKKALSILLILALICVPLAACGGGDSGTTPPAGGTDTPPAGGNDPAPPAGGNDPAPPAGGDIDDVSLRLWGGEEDQAMLRIMADAFIAHYANEAKITIEIGVESESSAKDTVLADIQAAADVFAFADDQVQELYLAGALQPVLLNTDAIIAANSAASVDAASVDGTLYAYPMTADNGYFMFYDSSFFSTDDIKTLDRMMDVAAEAGKQITMDIGGAWYLYSFFKGAGLEMGLNPDGVTNHSNWNTGNGPAVVESLLEITAHPGFVSLGDGEFVTGIKDGSIIAGVNGPWNSGNAMEAWGDNYAAAALPTFTLNGQQVQMSSFAGFKLLGVNALSENVGYAMLLAEWITNYENQMLRFEMRKQGPSNMQAASNPEVLADPGLAAIAAQAAFATPQRVGGSYWDPAATLGQIIVQGNPDNIPIQEMLDNAVAGITS